MDPIATLAGAMTMPISPCLVLDLDYAALEYALPAVAHFFSGVRLERRAYHSLTRSTWTKMRPDICRARVHYIQRWTDISSNI